MPDPNLYAPQWAWGAGCSRRSPGGLLVVLSGRPLLRTPAGTRRLEPGAVIAFPRGPEGAHRIANPDGEPARVLLLSTQNFPEVAEHLATGTTLTLTAPGEGKAFSED